MSLRVSRPDCPCAGHGVVTLGGMDQATVTTHRTQRGSWLRGLALGLVAGLLVWIGYFAQASGPDWFSWEASVVPAVCALAVAAGLTAAARPAARETWAGIAIGVVLAVPVVLAIFFYLIVFVLDLE